MKSLKCGKTKIKSIWIYIYTFFFLQRRKLNRHSHFILTMPGLLVGKVPLRFFFSLIVLFICLACAFLFKNAHDSFRNNKFSPIGIFNIFIVLFRFVHFWNNVESEAVCEESTYLKEKNNAVDISVKKNYVSPRKSRIYWSLNTLLCIRIFFLFHFWYTFENRAHYNGSCI